MTAPFGRGSDRLAARSANGAATEGSGQVAASNTAIRFDRTGCIAVQMAAIAGKCNQVDYGTLLSAAVFEAV